MMHDSQKKSQFKINLDRGLELNKNEKLDEAIQQFDRALQIDPNCIQALDRLAEIYKKKLEFETAITYHQRIIEINPNEINNEIRIKKIVTILGCINSRNLFYSSQDKIKKSNKIISFISFIYQNKKHEFKVDINTIFQKFFNSLAFFTMSIGGPRAKAGFTDQLMQFCIYYKLGKLSGINYIHSDFKSPRSSDIIYDFLGFNDYWEANMKNYNPIGEFKKIKIKFSDIILSHQIYSLNDLIEYINNVVACNSEANKQLAIVFLPLGKARQKLSSIINRSFPYFFDGLNLRSRYIQHQISSSKYQYLVKKNNNLIRAIIHIRLGDIGIIKSPWGNYISLQQDKIKEENEILNNKITINNFSEFIDTFRKSTTDLNISFNLFSDGYERTFNGLLDCQDLSPEKKQLLESIKGNYEQQEFKDFDRFNLDTKCIGESDEKLFQLIDNTINSQIIITSTNQRMMPKLISCFPNESNKQILIVLSKSNTLNFNSLIDAGLSPEKAHVFNINVLENLENQISPIVELISTLPLNSRLENERALGD